MLQRLLIIENSFEPIEPALLRLLAGSGAFQHEATPWDTFRPQRLGSMIADLVIAAAVPEHPNALEFLDWLRDHPIPIPTLAILPSDPNPRLLASASESVDDFVLWPVNEEELRHRVKRMIGLKRNDLESTFARLSGQIGLDQVVGSDPHFLRVMEKTSRVAGSQAPVLITGETGTGKELCARTIHYLSKRRNFPFIPVDCGALPDHLFENEVFGHVRGAYTDARTDQKGLIAMAAGGTLFLDEIDALTIGAQAKLLRFLQEKTYKPLGSDRFEHADVTVIAASNRDLEACVDRKEFRSDLYFRLNVLRLQLPPLRDRRTDIGPLARHFLATLVQSGSSESRSISAGALRKLCAYDWPGNVRELFNVIQRAAVFSDGMQILPCHIPLPGLIEDVLAGNFRQARNTAIQVFEKAYVEDLLRKHNGNVTQAAREAQQDRRAFGRLVKKHSIEKKTLQVG